jgi:hypothetical protein
MTRSIVAGRRSIIGVGSDADRCRVCIRIV